MKLLIGLIITLAGTQAFASGYLCKSNTHNIEVKIYNHTNPEIGTSKAAIMVISDSDVKSPNKTVAVFKNSKNTLYGGYNAYFGKVDLRVKELSKGEYLLGTRLAYLDYIVVGLAYSQKRPVANGAYVRGQLYAKKRNGQMIQSGLTCARYLKN